MSKQKDPQSPTEFVAANKRAISIPDAEPYFLDGASGIAYLILHGWSASAESMRFLAAGIAAEGHAVLVPTLPGHGSSSESMLAVGPVDWNLAARNAARSLRERYSQIVVIGVSMGGALAIQLAGSSPELVDGIATVNAPVLLSNSSFAREIVGAPATDFLAGWDAPSYFGPEVEEFSYENRFKKSGADLYSMCALARDMLPLVKAPMLVVQSLIDPIVPKESGEEIFARTGAARKQAVWLEQSYHVSQLDIDRDRVVAAALEFFGRG
jgi:carboxylesterase